MNKPDSARSDDVFGDLLVRLGQDLSGPLDALVEEVHVLDERIADDDGAAHLVELAYDLHSILEPLTAFAQLESTSSEEPSRVDVCSWVAKATSAPDVAAAFRLSVHGELGVSFDGPGRLEAGLRLCLRLASRMAKAKTRLHVHREVHEPTDRIVFRAQLNRPEPLALAVLNRAAHLMGAKLELDDGSLTLGFGVGTAGEQIPETNRAPARPVLAFRREESSSPPEKNATGRAALILVVDGEPAAQAYMVRLLELEGFDVVSCSTLEHAHEAAHAYRPDVIIVDRLQLSREDSDWVRRFRKEPAIGRTPLVLMQSAESESLGLVNVSDVVSKPIDPTEVIATIERLTGTGSPAIVVLRDSKDGSKWQRCLEGQARVITASNVAEAVRLLDTVTPKFLVVDVRHVAGAIELLEGLRRGGCRVPVVAIHGRLSKKARLGLDAVVDVRLTYSELSRRSLETVLVGLDGEGRRAELGAG